ncbi:hypothetical protein BH11PSE8_BH11PSE8_37880 [soil metagenome]
MLTITAIIRVKTGCEQAMRDALLMVADNAGPNEPGTIGFFVSQDPDDTCLFTTYERFTDQAAMDRHNGSETVAKFYGMAGPMLDGEVVLVKAVEVSAKA